MPARRDSVRAAVEAVIAESTEKPAEVIDESSVGGGCINEARVVSLACGRRFFVKQNPAPLPMMFEREAEGLAALAAVGAIRVPEPIGTAPSGVTPFIVIEYVEPGRPGTGFFREFGRQFAALHMQSTAQQFGFEHDNYIGSTDQPNAWAETWVEFWRERRLAFQMDLARKNGLSDKAMDRLSDSLMDRLDEFIDEPNESPCLLHGDLWGGNYLVDGQGQPVLIDPACYYGRREADLAMTMLFGGFDQDFYRAYEEAFPLAAGSETRIDVYKLYHLLNHLNLFGGSYRGGCMAILRRLVG